MLVEEIIAIIDKIAPQSQQEPWDNSGLQVGDPNQTVTSVLLCVDISERVLNEAAEKQCDMIISHHPLFFHSPKKISRLTSQGRNVIRAIKNDIAIYSSHTSIDKYLYGVSGKMAEKLGISNFEILHPSEQENVGLGVIGEFDEPLNISQFLLKTKNVFNVSYLRYCCTKSLKEIKKVAMCGGAGGDFIEMAIERKADAYITADLKYHEMQKGAEHLLIVDIDHWISEHFVVDVFFDLLHHLNNKIKIVKSEQDHSPIEIF